VRAMIDLNIVVVVVVVRVSELELNEKIPRDVSLFIYLSILTDGKDHPPPQKSYPVNPFFDHLFMLSTPPTLNPRR